MRKKQVIVLIRLFNKQYWGTVRFRPTKDIYHSLLGFFCYDTMLYDTIKEVKEDVKDFCRYKNLMIYKYKKNWEK